MPTTNNHGRKIVLQSARLLDRQLFWRNAPQEVTPTLCILYSLKCSGLYSGDSSPPLDLSLVPKQWWEGKVLVALPVFPRHMRNMGHFIFQVRPRFRLWFSWRIHLLIYLRPKNHPSITAALPRSRSISCTQTMYSGWRARPHVTRVSVAYIQEQAITAGIDTHIRSSGTPPPVDIGVYLRLKLYLYTDY